MARKKEPYKVVWYVNVPNEDGGVTPVLVKDVDGVIKPEHEELVAEVAKRMQIRCAKIIAAHRGLDIEIIED